jgi:hypothetical protein
VKKSAEEKNNVRVFNRGLLGNGAVRGLPNLAAGSLAPQASDDKADRLAAQFFARISQIFSCEKSAVVASSNIFLRKDARFGGTQPQLAKRATAAGYRPKLL